jgi:hypothetical protein
MIYEPNREAAGIWAQIPGGERILPTQNAVGAETGGPRYQLLNTNFRVRSYFAPFL